LADRPKYSDQGPNRKAKDKANCSYFYRDQSPFQQTRQCVNGVGKIEFQPEFRMSHSQIELQSNSTNQFGGREINSRPPNTTLKIVKL
jgi:hypothetical protein